MYHGRFAVEGMPSGEILFSFCYFDTSSFAEQLQQKRRRFFDECPYNNSCIDILFCSITPANLGSWSLIKTRDSFGILRMYRFQNCPWFWYLIEIYRIYGVEQKKISNNLCQYCITYIQWIKRQFSHLWTLFDMYKNSIFQSKSLTTH